MNLDELERLLAEATPGPWTTHSGEDGESYDCWIVDPAFVNVYGHIDGQDAKDAKAIVALRNEAPRLLAMARAGEMLRAEVEHARSTCYKHYAGDDACACPRYNTALAAWKEAWG
jgi:hypothetical protein